MSARAMILATLKRSLKVGEQDQAARRAAVDGRLAQVPAGIIPERGSRPMPERVSQFCDMAEAVNATVARLPAGEVPAAIAAFLRQHNLPQQIVRGHDPLLAALPWERAPQLAAAIGPADGTEKVGLSRALAGIAETGTLILVSGQDNPTTINFLPETHLVLLRASDIHGSYEAAWQALRGLYGKGRMPRTVNMITGPSRSADIEQTLLLGAHGPRRLHIMIIEGDA